MAGEEMKMGGGGLSSEQLQFHQEDTNISQELLSHQHV